MQNLKKTLGNFDSPEIASILILARTQSKRTLCNWSIAYAKERLLPLYEAHYPNDLRPRLALENALGWLAGQVKFVDAKETNNDAHHAATQASNIPAAQAAARAIAHAALTIHVSAHCLGIVFYGAAAIAYDQLGTNALQEEYLEIARKSWNDMETALAEIAISDEPDPARINTDFWFSRIR